MKIIVLGSAAGGGYPQWNCNCALCGGLRRGALQAAPRMQSSIAVSVDDENWLLLNASPDLGQQIRGCPPLHPRGPLRGSPLRAVLLMDAQVDHVAGLLSLREGLPIEASKPGRGSASRWDCPGKSCGRAPMCNSLAAASLLDRQPRMSPTYRLQHEEAQDSWVLLYPEGMVRLNEAASEILKRCDGSRSVQQVVDELQEAFGEASLQADVCDFMSEAYARGWVL
jgi:coenzyme PQQ biosynthesis protein PqqD